MNDQRILLKSPENNTAETISLTMTVIMTLPSSLSIVDKIMTSSNDATPEGNITSNTATTMKSAPPPLPPATEEEAKRRFNLALTKGVETLVEQGHGHDRASAELLKEIANGCSPDEEEVSCFLIPAGRGR